MFTKKVCTESDNNRLLTYNLPNKSQYAKYKWNKTKTKCTHLNNTEFMIKGLSNFYFKNLWDVQYSIPVHLGAGHLVAGHLGAGHLVERRLGARDTWPRDTWAPGTLGRRTLGRRGHLGAGHLRAGHLGAGHLGAGHLGARHRKCLKLVKYGSYV